MKIMLTVLRYTLLRNSRDSASILELVLMPFLTIFVLGSALGAVFEPRDIDPTPVAYVIEASGPAAESLRGFLSRDDVGRLLDATEVSSLDEAHRLLDAQEAVAAIHLPPGFDEANGGPGAQASIRLIERTGNALRGGIVRAVVGNFVHAANVTVALATLDDTDFAYRPIPARFDEQVLSQAGRAPGAFDFYSVSMLVLTVLFCAAYAVDAMKEDLLAPVGRRVRAAPVTRIQHVGGKLAAHVLTSLVQGFFLVAATALLFNVGWGGRPLLLFAIVGAMGLFAIAFGAAALAVTRDGQKAQTVVSVAVIGSMILSGGAFRFGNVGPIFRSIQQMLPHYHGQTALLEMIYGGSPGAVPAAFAYLLGGAAVCITITTVLMKRSET